MWNCKWYHQCSTHVNLPTLFKHYLKIQTLWYFVFITHICVLTPPIRTSILRNLNDREDFTFLCNPSGHTYTCHHVMICSNIIEVKSMDSILSVCRFLLPVEIKGITLLCADNHVCIKWLRRALASLVQVMACHWLGAKSLPCELNVVYDVEIATTCAYFLGLYSLTISWSLEAARFEIKHFQSPWNLTMFLWERFPHKLPFVVGIHRSPLISLN